MRKIIKHPRQPRRLRESSQMWKRFAEYFPPAEHFGVKVGIKLPKRLHKLHMRFSQLEDYERLAESRLARFRREKELLAAEMESILAAQRASKP